MQRIV